MKRLLLFVLLIPLMVLSHPEPEPMVVRGLVVNQHNEPLPHANVIVIDEKGNKKRVQTNDEGQFEIQVAHPSKDSDFTLCVEYATYEKQEQPIKWKVGEEKVVVKMKQSFQPIFSPEPLQPIFSKAMLSAENHRIQTVKLF